ncbi:MAG TPA: hypothetical protein VHW60_21695 [Caulobacteraceae bacterium]|nr:hypothetical protein [Caulobacteraceae bacterium]
MSALLAAATVLAACGGSPPPATQTAQANAPAQAGPAPASAPNQAAAQGGPSIVGAWSGQSPAQGGMARGADLYNADGSFVSVMQLPNGTIERVWGLYQATPQSANQLSVQFQVQGYLPTQICAQAPGFAVQCNPTPPPSPGTQTVVLTSPTSLQVNGTTMQRDNAPALLQVNVPQQLVLNAQAPTQPNIPQPVAPGGARYNSAPAQNFINGYMRGCTQDAQGRWVGCQQ